MSTCANMTGRLLLRLIAEEHGQDVIEYALLGTLLGLAGAAAFGAITTNMAASYTTWDSDVQNLWELPAPSAP